MQNISERNDPKKILLTVFSIEPRENNGTVLFINSDFTLEIPYGYKSYPVYSIYKLGELDEKRGGGTLLKKSIESTFGIKTDNYVLFKSGHKNEIPSDREEFSNFKKKNFSFLGLLPYFRLLLSQEIFSDMNFSEKFRFVMAVRSLNSADITFSDLSKTKAGVSTKLADGSSVLTVDQAIFDSLYSDNFLDTRVRKESYSVEVQNSTGVEKIAKQFARILEMTGAHVILTSTGDSISNEACSLSFKIENAEKSIISDILRHAYSCRIVNADMSNSQADIKIVIGEGFLK